MFIFSMHLTIFQFHSFDFRLASQQRHFSLEIAPSNKILNVLFGLSSKKMIHMLPVFDSYSIIEHTKSVVCYMVEKYIRKKILTI